MIDDWGLPYSKVYCLKRPDEVIRHYLRKIKYFFQRGYRGYADCDVWSVDYYLDAWLPSVLRELKKSHGIPGIMYVKNYTEETCDSKADEEAADKWISILEAMAQGFEADRDLNDCKWKDDASRNELEKVKKKGMQLFIKYYNCLWD